MKVGDRIRLRRIELGLTQDRLAKKLGRNSRSSVCMIEKRDNLTVKTLSQYAKALECSEKYLLGCNIEQAFIREDLLNKIMERPEYLSLVTIFSKMNEEHQIAIIEQIEFFLSKEDIRAIG